MKANPFTDAVLGEWHLDKKSSKGDFMCFVRERVIELAKIHAQDFFDPETNKKQTVYGELKLIQKKLISKETSATSLFQSIEKMPKTIAEDVIL